MGELVGAGGRSQAAARAAQQLRHLVGAAADGELADAGGVAGAAVDKFQLAQYALVVDGETDLRRAGALRAINLFDHVLSILISRLNSHSEYPFDFVCRDADALTKHLHVALVVGELVFVEAPGLPVDKADGQFARTDA